MLENQIIIVELTNFGKNKNLYFNSFNHIFQIQKWKGQVGGGRFLKKYPLQLYYDDVAYVSTLYIQYIEGSIPGYIRIYQYLFRGHSLNPQLSYIHHILTHSYTHHTHTFTILIHSPHSYTHHTHTFTILIHSPHSQTFLHTPHTYIHHSHTFTTFSLIHTHTTPIHSPFSYIHHILTHFYTHHTHTLTTLILSPHSHTFLHTPHHTFTILMHSPHSHTIIHTHHT